MWKPTSDTNAMFEGRDHKTDVVKWIGSHADLVFGSNSLLRAIRFRRAAAARLAAHRSLFNAPTIDG